MVLPYSTERAPHELFAIMPPMVARLAVEMSGAKRDVVRPQRGVQLVEHDARLDSRPALGGVHLEDAVEILRRVDHESGADRLPGLRRAAAAHGERTAKLRADADEADRDRRAIAAATTPSGSIW